MTVPIDWAELDALVRLATAEERKNNTPGHWGPTLASERWRRYRDAYEKRRAHLATSVRK